MTSVKHNKGYPEIHPVASDNVSHTALDCMPYPVFCLDVVEINSHSFKSMVGTALNGMAHETFLMDNQGNNTIHMRALICKRDHGKFTSQLSFLMHSKTSITNEFRLKTQFGKKHFNILMTISDQPVGHQQIFLVIQPSASDELKLALDKAADQHREEATGVVTTLLAKISHDLRTPLNSIIGFSQMIEDEMLGPVGTAQYREYATMISKSGRGLLDQFNEQTSRERLAKLQNHDAYDNYEQIIELSPDMICICSDGIFTKINAAGVALLGMWDAQDLEGRNFNDFVHNDYKSIVTNNMTDMIDEERMIPMKLIRGDGREVAVEINVLPYQANDDGYQNSVIMMARDMTERQRATIATIDREEQIRKTMDTVADGIVIVDSLGKIEALNLSGENIFNCSHGELIGSNFSALLDNAVTEEKELTFAQVLDHDGAPLAMNTLYELRGKRQGEETPFPLEITLNELNLGTRNLLIGSFRDISKRKKQEQKLLDLATRDPLSGLANRYLFEQCINKSIVNADQAGERFAIMNIDLNNFKNVNEAFGHVFGDKLLVSISKRLVAIIDNNTTLFHMGSDDFYILVEGNPDATSLETIAKHIISQVALPLSVDDKEIFTSCTIGICIYPDTAKDRIELMQHTDSAIYHAKKTDPGGHVFFAEHLSQQAQRRLDIERNLRRAVERMEFHLLYQPKVDLKTGIFTGCEALIRWECRELGSVYPDEFIPIAEHTGLIIEIGQWVMDEACKQGSFWMNNGLPNIKVAVNLSAIQFQHGDLEERILKSLSDANYPATQLDVELTESMLIENPEHTISTLNALKSHGMTTSMDDFGTGYSSLSYLTRFPLDYLKVDRSFVMNLPDDKDAAALVRAIITMAKQLGVELIAEGIETKSQETFLNALGCETGQGYLFGKPMTAEEFKKLALKSFH